MRYKFVDVKFKLNFRGEVPGKESEIKPNDN